MYKQYKWIEILHKLTKVGLFDKFHVYTLIGCPIYKILNLGQKANGNKN